MRVSKWGRGEIFLYAFSCAELKAAEFIYSQIVNHGKSVPKKKVTVVTDYTVASSARYTRKIQVRLCTMSPVLAMEHL